MKLRNAMVLILGLATLAVPALAAPGIYSNVKDTSLDHAACMARARQVIAAHGFRDISNGTWSTFGFRNDHTIVVRCVPEKALVFVVVAGPVFAECERLTEAVTRDF